MRISDAIVIDDNELRFSFVRASGPGGQNVNKVSSAVQLRFNVASPSLRPEVRERLTRLAGKRLTRDGDLLIDARRHRSQEMNREDAVARLTELIRQAAVRPTPRRVTRPSRGARQRRLDNKKRRGAIKRIRRQLPAD